MAHGMSATAVWWMLALMATATVGFWVLVAVVVRLVLTRPGAVDRRAAVAPSGPPVLPLPAGEADGAPSDRAER